MTYLGFVHGTLAALHRMLPRDRGTVVQVGSALAYASDPNRRPLTRVAKPRTRWLLDARQHKALGHLPLLGQLITRDQAIA